MNVLTAQQMAAADSASLEAGISMSSLIEQAGAAVARFCSRYYPDAQVIAVFCGKGNNGGDGLVAARHLARSGRRVRVGLLAAESELRGEPANALAALREHTEVELHFLASNFAPEATATAASLSALGDDAHLLIDAVVGTGFKPPLRGWAATVRDWVAHRSTPVVAVDLPSGWDADATAEHGEGEKSEAYRADAVVTFAAPKLAHVFGHLTPGKTFGPVVVAPIGTPEEAMPAGVDLRWAGSSLAPAQRPRDINGNKGRFGHVLVVGGSLGKSGAPAMASLAALRTGAGLVTAAVSREVMPGAAITPELMSLPLPSTADGGLSLDTLSPDALPKLLKGKSVVAIGPGLGQEGTTPEFVCRFVEQVELPMVIDADALNAFAGRTARLKEITYAARAQGKSRTIVLTPHPGEMARLIDSTVKGVEADRAGVARRFATEHGVTLVLKGWRTLIAHPDGRLAVNTTGNPGMAKGGSGDVLTGIVAAMLAQYKEDVARAVEAAVFLHGLAGDFATLDQDEHTILATDTVAHLARAFRTRVEDPEGFTWLAGLAGREQHLAAK